MSNINEQIKDAFRNWVEATDPPPVGITMPEWVNIVLSYSSDDSDIGLHDFNDAGREHWGTYWEDIENTDTRWQRFLDRLTEPDEKSVAPFKSFSAATGLSEHQRAAKQRRARPIPAVIVRETNDAFNQLRKLLDEATGAAHDYNEDLSDRFRELMSDVDGCHHDFMNLILDAEES